MMTFKNPANGHRETVSGYTWLWCLLFGPFYFAYKGIWKHVAISLVLAIFTADLSAFIYAFFAKGIVIDSYRNKGWTEVYD